MTIQRESPGTAGGGIPGIENNTHRNHTTSKRPLKWRRVLTALHAGRSFNRFEAERALADHCLHTTVSVLQGKGLTILRRDEVVPGYAGTPTHVNRYWLAPDSRERAAELLGLSVTATQGDDKGAT